MGRPLKFTEDRQKVYLKYIRQGSLKHEAARKAGLHPETVRRHKRAHPEFQEREDYALMEALEGVEKVVYDLAIQGDLSAAKMWLQAHARSTYGDKQVTQLDVSDNVLQLSADETTRRMIELKQSLEQRALDAGIIDVEEVE